MPKKQVFLLFDNNSEKDMDVANQFAAFLDYNGSNISLNEVIAGENIEEFKKRAMSSDAIIPLVSIDFLKLDSAIDLVAEAKQNNKKIFPILFRQCPWDEIPALKSLEDIIMPKDKALNEFDENKTDTLFNNITKNIKSAIFNGPKTEIDRTYGLLFLIVLAVAVVASFFAYSKWVVPPEKLQESIFDMGTLAFVALIIFWIVILFVILTRIFPEKFQLKKSI